MKKILIIVENELLAQLYRTNFTVYLNANVKWINSFELYHKEIKANLDYDLIVTEAVVHNFNMFPDLLNVLKDLNLSTPVISIGDTNITAPNLSMLKESLNIQSILSLASKILGVTAQMMASISVPEYFPIEIEFIMYLKKAPTNLFLKIEDDFVLFANKEGPIVDLIKSLKKEGVQTIFVKSIERLEIVAKITEILKNGLIESKSLSVAQKTEVVSAGFDFFINNFVSQEAAQEIVHTANICARVMNEVVEDSKDMQALYALFKDSKNNFLYIHTMLTVYVSTHIIRNVQWGGENQVEKLNFVIFFHDIILAPIFMKYPHLQSEEAMLTSDELSRHEKQTVLNHARLGAESVATLKKCPIGSDQLIKQHHGMSTGIGFATEYKDDISPMAKVIIIAEAFVEEFIAFRESHGNASIDMVEFIQKLNDKFKKNSYKKIIETLLTIRL